MTIAQSRVLRQHHRAVSVWQRWRACNRTIRPIEQALLLRGSRDFDELWTADPVPPQSRGVAPRWRRSAAAAGHAGHGASQAHWLTEDPVIGRGRSLGSGLRGNLWTPLPASRWLGAKGPRGPHYTRLTSITTTEIFRRSASDNASSRRVRNSSTSSGIEPSGGACVISFPNHNTR